jgi:hypothetical protein
MRRTFPLSFFLGIGYLATCCAGELDPYGANGPCSYLFKQPGGNCRDGKFTVETEVGQERKIISSKVVSLVTSTDSVGSVEPIAKCVAEHMDFYARWYVEELDKPGKQVTTIHVINDKACR